MGRVLYAEPEESRMEEILSGYQTNSVTWFYYSLLLIVTLFFKFNRLWSLRNFDLLLLLSISPGLIFISHGESPGYQPAEGQMHAAAFGHGWIFVLSILLLLRLMFDGFLKRRPRLEQNLNVPGMTFLALSAFTFLMTEAAMETPPQSVVNTIREGHNMIHRVEDTSVEREVPPKLSGPTQRTLAGVSNAISGAVVAGELNRTQVERIAVRTMTIIAHIAVLTGLFFVGRNQFGDAQLGVAMATFYLLIPCTAHNVHRADQVIPAALVVWAIAAHRKPVWSGIFFGLACGAVFFPIFLLPVWLMYYRGRGAARFATSLAVTGAILVSTLVLTSSSTNSFHTQLLGTIDWSLLKFERNSVSGFWLWNTDSWAYRIPIFVCYLIGIVVMAVRTAGRKNFESLIAYTAVIVLGTQFWYCSAGGVYVLWYLPILLLVVFRPRLGHLVPPERGDNREAQVHRPLASDASRVSAMTRTRSFR
jgi:hypothetical protein